MTDQSMIEKVARAIRAEIDRYWQDDSVQPDDNAIAIAAIKAMREPTLDMLDQGGWALLNQIEGSEAMEAKACYRAMIDAALKGEGE